ncbi:MAG: hypothetical protein GZ088_00205 [Acidipila sp.]|nr:hypothetical protein [Acidipila sp.]
MNDSLCRPASLFGEISLMRRNSTSAPMSVLNHNFVARASRVLQRLGFLSCLLTVALISLLALVMISCGDGTGASAGTPGLTFSNASLKGQYAFSFVGTDTGGPAMLAGTFLSDGNGNINSGVEDSNAISGILTNEVFNGTYSIGPDGRGSATITNSRGLSHLQFVIISVNRALIIQFDTFASGTGSINQQAPTDFNVSAISGAYVINFYGFSAVGSSYVATGILTADGRGALLGVIDENDGDFKPNLPLAGTYTLAPNGRGTAILATSSATSHFSFYVISRSVLTFVELDSLPFVSGVARAQQGAPFAISSFSGDYAFGAGGQTVSGPFASAGRLTADGRGTILAGVRDDNDTVNVTRNLAFTGAYTVSPQGRGTGTLTSPTTSYTLLFYMISQTEAVLMSSDPALVSIGEMSGQQSAPFGDSSVHGRFGVMDSILTGGLEQDVVSQITIDGAGTGHGLQDLNAGLLPTPPTVVTATFSISANGRVMATMSGARGQSDFALYLASSSRAYLVGLNPGVAERGLVEKQY